MPNFVDPTAAGSPPPAPDPSAPLAGPIEGWLMTAAGGSPPSPSRPRKLSEKAEDIRDMTVQDHLDAACTLAAKGASSDGVVRHHATIQTQLMFALVKQGMHRA